MKRLLILDNYDSFTYNLVQLVEQISDMEFEVHRNDKIALEDINRFDKILLSPGPGIPCEAGLLPDIIKTYGETKSIFGVCLGLQAIGEAYGGKLKNQEQVFHGIATTITITNPDTIFNYCPNSFLAGRYHSWTIDNNFLPDTLEVTATDDNGNIMAIKHKTLDVRGVQFHPESILSQYGKQILHSWLSA